MTDQAAAPPTSELAAFIEARLSEWQGEAKACDSITESPWRTGFYQGDDRVIDGEGALVATCETSIEAGHIARHDPARVLAQVAALRAVVEKAKWAIDVEGGGAEDFADFTLRHLATIWASNPAFDPAWSA